MLSRIGNFFLDILQVVVFAVAIFLFVYLLVMQPHKIKGNSMDPTFKNGEFILTDKVTYRFSEPKRGDVIVFKAPPTDKEEFIKRIIGLPGDKILLKNDQVYVNSKKLAESEYLDISVLTFAGNFLAESEEIKVPEGEYFVLGDNRPHSSDSRTWGFLKKEKITGRAWLIYWPPEKAGIFHGALYPSI